MEIISEISEAPRNLGLLADTMAFSSSHRYGTKCCWERLNSHANLHTRFGSRLALR
jgi:hypothetical protein